MIFVWRPSVYTELLQGKQIQADETPTTVRLEDQKGSKKAYVWVYQWKEKVVFDFTMTRERDGPRRFLGDWSGALQTDGYSGYDEVVRENRIERAGCWAHARRKVKEAMDTGSKSAVRLLRAINRVFWIERGVKRRAVGIRGIRTLRGHELSRTSPTPDRPVMLSRPDPGSGRREGWRSACRARKS